MTKNDKLDVVFREARPITEPAARYPGFSPEDVILPKGWKASSESAPLSCDVHVLRDVAVMLRDGQTLYVDIFRPVDGPATPTIVGWGPYGKRGGVMMLDDLPFRGGVPKAWQSGLEMFEGPDPAYWCAHGYSIVNVDARGTFSSTGDIHCWGSGEGKDASDVMDWIAKQPWSTGKIGMSGTSWLAIIQWFIAAEENQHLAAIAPCEGWTDLYRNDVVRGGIQDVGFNERMIGSFAGGGQVEDVPEMVRRFPLMNSYWESKIPDLAAINIPAYVVSSWTNLIHTRGTLEGFEKLGSDQKWLRVHNTHEWHDYYSHEDDLRLFFDHFLKGEENEWLKMPKVRLSILNPEKEDVVDRPETSFPLERTEVQSLFLAPDQKLEGEGVMEFESYPKETFLEFSTDDSQGMISFSHRFTSATELAGYFSARLWVEIMDHDDADIYVEVRKIFADGRRAVPINFQAETPAETERLKAEYLADKAVFGMMFFSGAKGMLRVSHREVDEKLSSLNRPYHLHKKIQKVASGDIVPIDIPIWPFGMQWEEGEQIQLLISSRKLSTPELPGVALPYNVNKGRIRVHFGGAFPSQLTIPVTG